MTDFVLLGEGGRMPETDAEREEIMSDWAAWTESLGSSLKDPGSPMMAAKAISPDGAVTDGSSTVTGYFIVTADSIDDAVAIAKACPVLRFDTSITVFETFPPG